MAAAAVVAAASSSPGSAASSRDHGSSATIVPALASVPPRAVLAASLGRDSNLPEWSCLGRSPFFRSRALGNFLSLAN
eukprot:scaffold87084_cov48-Phaeocystis_antarctica.AAC.1